MVGASMHTTLVEVARLIAGTPKSRPARFRFGLSVAQLAQSVGVMPEGRRFESCQTSKSSVA